MLTGRETVPAALAATGWQHRELPALDGRTWGDLVRRVRHLALGLGDGVGTVGLPGSSAGALAVLAAGGVLDLDAPPGRLDEEALVAAGASIDEREPDAFERRWREVTPGDEAVRGDGGLSWSHGGLLWAARSVVQALDLGAGDRLLVSGVDGVRALVLGVLAPVLSGATPSTQRSETVKALGPSVIVLPAVAVPVAVERPLPGVTVAIADDGEVLVRSDAVSPSACGEHGWLHTGRTGRLDGERLVLDR